MNEARRLPRKSGIFSDIERELYIREVRPEKSYPASVCLCSLNFDKNPILSRSIKLGRIDLRLKILDMMANNWAQFIYTFILLTQWFIFPRFFRLIKPNEKSMCLLEMRNMRVLIVRQKCLYSCKGTALIHDSLYMSTSINHLHVLFL